ncbi:MAG: LemA family protein [Candidatus Cloacimonadia bacterium]|jgi:LemA protein
MKNFLIVLLIVVVLLIGLVGFTISRYNSMQQLKVDIDNSWAEVQNQLMRRYDLIPNLVETVKGYASHEQETFRMVTEARASVGGIIEVSQDVLDNPEAFQRYQQAQNTLGGALQRLLAVSENYPELKANQNFIRLQDELAGTENRIAVSRKRFNDSVAVFNRLIVVFPNNIIAGMFNFQKAIFFEAPTETQEAPRVQF